VVEFDGYGAALGEWWHGSARGYDDAAIVIAGTGVGAGVIHGGRLYRGASTIAGGIGWFRFPRASVQGRRLEDLASGPAILAHARRLNGRDRAAYPDTAAVFAAGEGGDLAAQRAIERGMVALASGVGAIVALLAPEIVVLGGSVGARPDTVARVRELVATMTQPFAMQTVKIEGSSLGPLSSLYGAAYFAHQLDQGKEP
jgi:predicted NBD/HSP70 family sugar kinase